MVVAGLLTGRSDSPPARILDGMLTARFPFLLSIELLAEYRAVLLREPIRDRHRLDEQEVEAILTEIAANGIVRAPEEIETEGFKTDPGDRHLIRLLAISSQSCLVAGDQKLQLALREFCTVYSPAEFVGLHSL